MVVLTALSEHTMFRKDLSTSVSEAYLICTTVYDSTGTDYQLLCTLMMETSALSCELCSTQGSLAGLPGNLCR